MAYYNHGEGLRRKEAEECYENLKKDIKASLRRSMSSLSDREFSFEEISQSSDAQVLKKYFTAAEHMERKEAELQKANEELSNYRKFFGMLSSLLPKQFSIHDTIG